MPSKLGLTETQYMIMTYFWEKNCELTVGMVRDYFSQNGHPWAIQTVQTHLECLVKKGALAINRQGHQKKYYAELSRLSYASQWMKRMIAQNFDNGVSDFIVALSGFGDSLDSEQKEELKNIWNE